MSLCVRVCVLVSLHWIWDWMMCVSVEHRLAWMLYEVICVYALYVHTCACACQIKKACRGWVCASQRMVYVCKKSLSLPPNPSLCACVFLKFTLSVICCFWMWFCVCISSHIGGIHLLVNICWPVWKYKLTMFLTVSALIRQHSFVSLLAANFYFVNYYYNVKTHLISGWWLYKKE